MVAVITLSVSMQKISKQGKRQEQTISNHLLRSSPTNLSTEEIPVPYSHYLTMHARIKTQHTVQAQYVLQEHEEYLLKDSRVYLTDRSGAYCFIY